MSKEYIVPIKCSGIVQEGVHLVHQPNIFTTLRFASVMEVSHDNFDTEMCLNPFLIKHL